MQASALQNHKPSLFMTPLMAPLGSQGSPYALPLLKVHVSSAASQVPRALPHGSEAGNSFSWHGRKLLGLPAVGPVGCRCYSEAGLRSSLGPGLVHSSGE